MDGQRSCAWMSGPSDSALKVSSTKWWLAISHDILVKDYRRQVRVKRRPASHCDRVPIFNSPLTRRTS
jgi:hypothetical protein